MELYLEDTRVLSQLYWYTLTKLTFNLISCFVMEDSIYHCTVELTEYKIDTNNLSGDLSGFFTKCEKMIKRSQKKNYDEARFAEILQILQKDFDEYFSKKFRDHFSLFFTTKTPLIPNLENIFDEAKKYFLHCGSEGYCIWLHRLLYHHVSDEFANHLGLKENLEKIFDELQKFSLIEEGKLNNLRSISVATPKKDRIKQDYSIYKSLPYLAIHTNVLEMFFEKYENCDFTDVMFPSKRLGFINYCCYFCEEFNKFFESTSSDIHKLIDRGIPSHINLCALEGNTNIRVIEYLNQRDELIPSFAINEITRLVILIISYLDSKDTLPYVEQIYKYTFKFHDLLYSESRICSEKIFYLEQVFAKKVNRILIPILNSLVVTFYFNASNKANEILDLNLKKGEELVGFYLAFLKIFQIIYCCKSNIMPDNNKLTEVNKISLALTNIFMKIMENFKTLILSESEERKKSLVVPLKKLSESLIKEIDKVLNKLQLTEEEKSDLKHHGANFFIKLCSGIMLNLLSLQLSVELEDKKVKSILEANLDPEDINVAYQKSNLYLKLCEDKNINLSSEDEKLIKDFIEEYRILYFNKIEKQISLWGSDFNKLTSKNATTLDFNKLDKLDELKKEIDISSKGNLLKPITNSLLAKLSPCYKKFLKSLEKHLKKRPELEKIKHKGSDQIDHLTKVINFYRKFLELEQNIDKHKTDIEVVKNMLANPPLLTPISEKTFYAILDAWLNTLEEKFIQEQFAEIPQEIQLTSVSLQQLEDRKKLLTKLHEQSEHLENSVFKQDILQKINPELEKIKTYVQLKKSQQRFLSLQKEWDDYSFTEDELILKRFHTKIEENLKDNLGIEKLKTDLEADAIFKDLIKKLNKISDTIQEKLKDIYNQRVEQFLKQMQEGNFQKSILYLLSIAEAIENSNQPLEKTPTDPKLSEELKRLKLINQNLKIIESVSALAAKEFSQNYKNKLFGILSVLQNYLVMYTILLDHVNSVKLELPSELRKKFKDLLTSYENFFSEASKQIESATPSNKLKTLLDPIISLLQTKQNIPTELQKVLLSTGLNYEFTDLHSFEQLKQEIQQENNSLNHPFFLLVEVLEKKYSNCSQLLPKDSQDIQLRAEEEKKSLIKEEEIKVEIEMKDLLYFKHQEINKQTQQPLDFIKLHYQKLLNKKGSPARLSEFTPIFELLDRPLSELLSSFDTFINNKPLTSENFPYIWISLCILIVSIELFDDPAKNFTNELSSMKKTLKEYQVRLSKWIRQKDNKFSELEKKLEKICKNFNSDNFNSKQFSAIKPILFQDGENFSGELRYIWQNCSNLYQLQQHIPTILNKEIAIKTLVKFEDLMQEEIKLLPRELKNIATSTEKLRQKQPEFLQRFLDDSLYWNEHLQNLQHVDPKVADAWKKPLQEFKEALNVFAQALIFPEQKELQSKILDWINQDPSRDFEKHRDLISLLVQLQGYLQLSKSEQFFSSILQLLDKQLNKLIEGLNKPILNIQNPKAPGNNDASKKQNKSLSSGFYYNSKDHSFRKAVEGGKEDSGALAQEEDKRDPDALAQEKDQPKGKINKFPNRYFNNRKKNEVVVYEPKQPQNPLGNKLKNS